MSGDGPRRGLKSYVGTLVATLLFPILWMQALRLARRHAGDDPRGPLKVGVAIVFSVLILLGGAFVLVGFQESAKAGMYASLNDRLAIAVGEAEYKDSLAVIATANKAIPIIEANLVKERATLASALARNESAPSDDNAEAVAKSQGNITSLEKALADTNKARTDAQAKVALLEPNHVLYRDINASAQDQDDERIRTLFATAPAYPPGSAEGAQAALDIKDQSLADMRFAMWVFVWPSLAGAFFAPLAFALGSILRKAFVPSDTVGFKPYPGAAAGLFLLFGAFGLPSIPFAAWTFHDAFGRSEEGQIAL